MAVEGSVRAARRSERARFNTRIFLRGNNGGWWILGIKEINLKFLPQTLSRERLNRQVH